MRDGAEMTENGMVIRAPDVQSADEVVAELKETVAERRAKMWNERSFHILALRSATVSFSSATTSSADWTSGARMTIPFSVISAPSRMMIIAAKLGRLIKKPMPISALAF